MESNFKHEIELHKNISTMAHIQEKMSKLPTFHFGDGIESMSWQIMSKQDLTMVLVYKHTPQVDFYKCSRQSLTSLHFACILCRVLAQIFT